MLHYQSENQLLQALKAHDKFAYRELYERFARELLYFTTTIVPETSAAQDIVTETFIKIFEKDFTFDTLRKCKSFLFTTAHNAALDWLRHHKREQDRATAFSYHQPHAEEDKETLIINAELIQIIYQAIDQLHGQAGEVVRLALLEGKSNAEIAAQLNIAYKTVQNHKTDGLNNIRFNLLRSGMLSALILVSAYLLADTGN